MLENTFASSTPGAALGFDYAFDYGGGGPVVAEPSTWAMLAIEFAGLGYAGSRRKQRRSTERGLAPLALANDSAVSLRDVSGWWEHYVHYAATGSAPASDRA